jgi:hypothetical protein
LSYAPVAAGKREDASEEDINKFNTPLLFSGCGLSTGCSHESTFVI